jgi:hypothetical protein
MPVTKKGAQGGLYICYNLGKYRRRLRRRPGSRFGPPLEGGGGVGTPASQSLALRPVSHPPPGGGV